MGPSPYLSVSGGTPLVGRSVLPMEQPSHPSRCHVNPGAHRATNGHGACDERSYVQPTRLRHTWWCGGDPRQPTHHGGGGRGSLAGRRRPMHPIATSHCGTMCGPRATVVHIDIHQCSRHAPMHGTHAVQCRTHAPASGRPAAICLYLHGLKVALHVPCNLIESFRCVGSSHDCMTPPC